MNWNLYNAREHFAEIATAWDRLNQRLYGAHPFLNSRFVGPLLKYFSGPKSYLAILGSKREPQALALLERKNVGVWSSFLPSQAQISPLLFSEAKEIARLFETLPGTTIAIDILAQDPLFSAFADRQLPLVVSICHALTMNIETKTGFDAYWQARNKKLRNNIKRYFKRLEKDDIRYSLKIISSALEMPAALDRYGNIESAGWKGKQGTAIHTENVQGHFYNEVLKEFAENNNAMVMELHFNNKIVASRIAIKNDRLLVMLKTTFDEQYKKYAPGRLLLYLVLEKLFDDASLKTIEFYTNASQDQLSWATGSREICHHTVFRNNLAVFLHKTAHYGKQLIVRR